MRSLFPYAPARVKSALVRWVCRLPMKAWMPPLYWNTRWSLGESEWWDEARIKEFQVQRLRALLRHCATNVPYYRKLFRETGFDPETVRDVSDIRQLPLLDKKTVRRKAEELLAENIPGWQRCYFTTGGTSGKPLGLYDSREGVWRERAHIEHLWSRVGFSTGDLRGMFRGAVVRSSRHWSYDPKERAISFSNFHMTPQIAVEYAHVMRENEILFLHAYPSAALNFAQLLERQGIGIPRFKALLLVSENLYPGQRESLEKAYGCRVFSHYGHSEGLILAGECECSSDYHVEPDYGLAEVLRDDGSPANEGEDGELVGTTVSNYVMPLIRYRTGDVATLGRQSCRCGRAHQLIRNTRGRWLQEMLVGRDDNLISITSLNLHTDVFDRVEQFQFFQREKGKAELRLVKSPGYSERDSAAIVRALHAKMGGSVALTVRLVDSIELTPRGKFRFVIQELTVPQFSNIEA